MSSTDVSLPRLTWHNGWSREALRRRHQAETALPVLFGAGTFVIDVLTVTSAFLVAYWLRFVVPDDGGSALSIDAYARVGAVVGLLTTVVFASHGFYDEDRPPAWAARARVVVSSVSTALVIAATVSYFLGDQRYSRLWLGAGTGLAMLGLLVWRSFAHTLYLTARDRLAPTNRVIIVGANPTGEKIADELSRTHRVVGFVDNGSDLVEPRSTPLLGPIARLESLVHVQGATEVVVALPIDRHEQVRRVIARGFRRPVTIRLAPELDGMLPGRVEVRHVGGRPYIGFTPMAKVSWLKRTMDVVLGCAISIALLPLLVAIVIAIKLDSPGPVLYRQERVGKHGRRFGMYKFRSMRPDADRLIEQLRNQNEASGPLFKIRDDPRVTWVGRFLRRFSLDELPQLINVLRGEMSLVGPRPPVPSEVSQYDDWHLGRLRAAPGMTGLWQASGRSEVPFHDMVRLDLHYIQHWSLALDFEILVRTIPAVLSHRGAY